MNYIVLVRDLDEDKTVGPVTTIVYLGLEIDSENGIIRIPHENIISLIDLLETLMDKKKTTLKQLQSLVGSLNFICRTIPSDCPDNWISYEQSCYFISSQSASWKDAMIRCQKLNGHLAEITSADEERFLIHRMETLDGQNNRVSECFSASPNQYNGTITTTYDGHTCQRWDSQTPHTHTNTFPEGSVTDAANYCRDPDGEGLPWCYTTDPKIRWQYCGIYECPGGNYWAGMALLDDVWKWIHTETELDQGYTNWYHNQNYEYCGALTSEFIYQWKKSKCSHTAMYICEQTKYT
ncbi:apolipoprotein(a)-like [Ruditapes philippinarum]|uniref:apolipoprotein(a)-like n=1 Tax=Ruditapes philippinarum TaxID=129788 RepID=UPI00295BF93C|nr:apolipoprotein(a)-like [Ruditapes philippinarum]